MLREKVKNFVQVISLIDILNLVRNISAKNKLLNLEIFGIIILKNHIKTTKKTLYNFLGDF